MYRRRATRRASTSKSSPASSRRRARARRRLRRRHAAAHAAGRQAASTARGIEISQRGVNECVAAGLSVIQGDADTDLAVYPGQRVRLRDPVADAAGDAQSRASCSSRCCASAGTLSCRSRISATGGCACSWLDGRMPVTENLPVSWYDTPNIHFCTIRDFVALVRRSAPRSNAAPRSTLADTRCASTALVVLEFVRRAGGVPAVARAVSG